jgi:hypothetical protein
MQLIYLFCFLLLKQLPSQIQRRARITFKHLWRHLSTFAFFFFFFFFFETFFFQRMSSAAAAAAAKATPATAAASSSSAASAASSGKEQLKPLFPVTPDWSKVPLHERIVIDAARK